MQATVYEIAELHNKNIKTVCGVIGRFKINPVGRTPSPKRIGFYRYLYDTDEVLGILEKTRPEVVPEGLTTLRDYALKKNIKEPTLYGRVYHYQIRCVARLCGTTRRLGLYKIKELDKMLEKKPITRTYNARVKRK